MTKLRVLVLSFPDFTDNSSEVGSFFQTFLVFLMAGWLFLLALKQLTSKSVNKHLPSNGNIRCEQGIEFEPFQFSGLFWLVGTGHV